MRFCRRLVWENHASSLDEFYNHTFGVGAGLQRRVFGRDKSWPTDLPGELAVLERVQIIVVNDGSSDRTGEALARFKEEIAEYPNEKLNWQFITHEKNKGKAAAIHTALSAATEELCVIHDADLEYHPADLLKMVQVFVSEGADAVFGSRFSPASIGAYYFSVTNSAIGS